MPNRLEVVIELQPYISGADAFIAGIQALSNEFANLLMQSRLFVFP
jgi:hypothetical protein